jgi:hypothetical protein
MDWRRDGMPVQDVKVRPGGRDRMRLLRASLVVERDLGNRR